MSEIATLLHVRPPDGRSPSLPDRWTIHTVSSAAAANDQLDGSVDCVLVEHALDDGRDGLAVLDAIDACCPVFYRTAEPDGEVASAAAARGAVHYLHGGDDVAERISGVVDTLPTDRPSVLERIGEAYLSFDSDWNVTYINERAAELLDTSPSENSVSQGSPASGNTSGGLTAASLSKPASKSNDGGIHGFALTPSVR